MKIAIAIIVLVIALIAGYFLFVRTASAPTIEQPAAPIEATTSASAATTSSLPAPAAIVTYTDQGFSPNSVTVKKGQTVEFVNRSAGSMWIASNPHPIHSGYSGTTMSQHCPDTTGTAFDECTLVGAGGTYSFTFQKVGSWGYHNHADHTVTGTVVVTAS